MLTTERSPTTATTEELANRLRLAVTRLARRLRQETADGTPLTPSSSAALSTIERHGPLTPSDLADHERIQRPTATRIVGNLEQAGLVTRTQDPDDGRCTRIAATPEGRALLRNLRRRKTAYFTRRIDTLPDQDVATLHQAAAILERLLEEDA